MDKEFDKWWRQAKPSITDPTGDCGLDEALRMAWQAALKRAAEVLRNMPDRERMDGKWNPDPNGILMEHCPLSCAQAIERLGDK